MQTKLALALLYAAVNAAPSLTPRQATSIPVEIWEGTGCNTGAGPITTANVPTDGSCFGISPIVSGDTDSGKVSSSYTFPAGCTCKSTPSHSSACAASSDLRQ